MALLSKYRLEILAAGVILLAQACEFHPNLKDLGYPVCSRDSDCPSQGFVCLEGICVADCPGADPVVWLGADSEGNGVFVCPDRAQCERGERLEVLLPSGSYIELGPDGENDDPGCAMLLVRFSLIPIGGSAGAELNVLILGLDKEGRETMGILPDTLELEQERLDQSFVINPETFGWPVRMRLLSLEKNEAAHFEFEEYKLICCK
jgi:hypothetical protein